MKCNIIKDLLPSYLDEICSEESVEAVNEHLKTCSSCEEVFRSMQEVEVIPLIEEEIVQAKKPFKMIKRKTCLYLVIAIFLTVVIGYQLIQNVGVISDYIFPQIWATHVLETSDEEWQQLDVEGEAYFMFDSIFAKKELTNHANNESDITIRVKDREGQIIIDELTIQSGTSGSLKEMKLYEKYQIEIKTENERTFLCFS